MHQRHQVQVAKLSLNNETPRLVVYPGDEVMQAEARVYDFGVPVPVRAIPLDREACLRYGFNFLKLAMELKE
tara:strand:- start:261 stop:476 length:216 start_codon:yes stop_codon:yes gene_type:complete